MSEIKKSIVSFVKLLVFVLACYFVYDKVFSESGLEKISQIISLSKEGDFIYLFLIIILMPINWLIEAVKWKLLIKDLKLVTLFESTKAILIGTYYSLITPNRIGDVIGKLSILPKEKRKQGGYAFFTGSIAQLAVTIIVGSIAYLFLDIELFPKLSKLSRNLISFVLIIGSITMFAAYIIPSLRRKLAVLFGKNFLKDFILSYNMTQLQSYIYLSAFRYLIFSSQFVLSLLFFDVNIPIIEAYAAIGLVYLISAAIPTFVLGELGVRESTALLIMIPLGGDELGIFAATFFLWLVNLLLPSIAGAIINLSGPKKEIL